jgi:hypothetical protein
MEGQYDMPLLMLRFFALMNVVNLSVLFAINISPIIFYFLLQLLVLIILLPSHAIHNVFDIQPFLQLLNF